MLLQGDQGITCRSVLSPPMTWVPSTKFRVSGWQQAPLPTESGCQSDMSNIKNFYYCYEHSSREQNRIQIQNHSLCLHTNYMGLESIHDKKKKRLEGKEKINSMKTSTIFLLTRSKVLLPTDQSTSQFMDLKGGQTLFFHFNRQGGPPHNYFPNTKTS